MMKLTNKLVVPACLATPFDSKNPLPEVIFMYPKKNCTQKFPLPSSVDLCSLFLLVLLQDHLSLALRHTLPEEGLLVEEPTSSDPEAPETVERHDGDEINIPQRGLIQLSCLPLLILKTKMEREKENAKMN
jgi:hypothetical protein